ncbi:MAG: MFS transporter [Candidatus Gracilibacteria bacterium]|nr:MFS transporter [Candidatus Gracilibacteria bacterium]MDD2908958.1 MFS transporter [Candidatus Gracilibacteria bacterium]
MNKKIIILLFSIFLDILGFSFILPIVPFIVKGFGGNSFSVGLIVAGAAAGMFIGGILFGKLSDKYGRKKILSITILLNILGYLVFAVSSNLKIFFIARFLCGLGGGGVSVVQAYISDISKEKEKIINMGYVGASIGLGFTLGPIFGSFMSSLELKHMGFISALILIISFIFVYLFLPEEKPKVHKETHLKGTSNKLLILFLIYFITTITFSGIQTIFTLYLNSEFLFSSKNVGYVFGYMGIVSIIYQIFGIKYAYKYLKEYYMIIFGMLFMGVGLVLIGFNTNIFLLYILLIPVAVGLSNINSSVFSLVTNVSSKKDFGKNLGLNTAFGSVADIIGPLVSGALYLISNNLPFYVFGIMLLIIMIIFSFNKSKIIS